MKQKIEIHCLTNNKSGWEIINQQNLKTELKGEIKRNESKCATSYIISLTHFFGGRKCSFSLGKSYNIVVGASCWKRTNEKGETSICIHLFSLSYDEWIKLVTIGMYRSRQRQQNECFINLVQKKHHVTPLF